MFLKIYEHRNHVATTRVLCFNFSFIAPPLQVPASHVENPSRSQPNPIQSSSVPRTNPSQLRGFRSCRYDAWLGGKRRRCRSSCPSSLRIHIHVLSVCEFKSVCCWRRIWIWPGTGAEEILWPCGSPLAYKTQGRSQQSMTNRKSIFTQTLVLFKSHTHIEGLRIQGLSWSWATTCVDRISLVPVDFSRYFKCRHMWWPCRVIR